MYVSHTFVDSTVLNISKWKKITATEPQQHRNALGYFAIYKNVAHSLVLGEAPNNSASHQAPKYVPRFLNIAEHGEITTKFQF